MTVCKRYGTTRRQQCNAAAMMWQSCPDSQQKRDAAVRAMLLVHAQLRLQALGGGARRNAPLRDHVGSAPWHTQRNVISLLCIMQFLGCCFDITLQRKRFKCARKRFIQASALCARACVCLTASDCGHTVFEACTTA